MRPKYSNSLLLLDLLYQEKRHDTQVHDTQVLISK